MLNVEGIAKVCHAANNALRVCLGEEPREWEPNREASIAGVVWRRDNWDAPVSAQHDEWIKTATPEHPCYMPWKMLPREQRLKDAVFVGIVRAFAINPNGDPVDPKDPARAALARLLAAVKAMNTLSKIAPEDRDMDAIMAQFHEHNQALAEAERALEEPERDWKAEARDDWSKRALEDAK